MLRQGKSEQEKYLPNQAYNKTRTSAINARKLMSCNIPTGHGLAARDS